MRARLPSLGVLALAASGCSLLTGFADFRFGEGGTTADDGAVEGGRREGGATDCGGSVPDRHRCESGICEICCSDSDCAHLSGTPYCIENSCVCQSGTDCDDGIPCTADSCLTPGTCQNVVVTCADGNSCTSDACDPMTGACSYSTDCPTGEICGSAGTCATVSCTELAPCPPDPDACTAYVCMAGRCETMARLTCGMHARCFDRGGVAACGCDAGWGSCGGTSCDVQLTTDQQHCGSCGHSCADADCVGGVCQ